MGSLSATPTPPVVSAPAPSRLRALMLWPLRLVMGAVLVAALLGVQALMGRYVNEYNLQIITLAGVSVILAVSLNLISGITGQFSLGHAGFMAVGAYTSAAFTYYAGPRLVLIDEVVFVISLVLAAFASGLAGLLVGLPSLRLRGDYLAIVTLGFGMIIIAIIRNTKALGEATGFVGLPHLTNFAWVWGCAILCILTVRNLADSTLGRSMRAVRDDEVAAEAAGIDTTRIKVLAFVVSSMWAGVAGGLQAHLLMIAHPDNFAFLESVKIVVMVVLGGLGSITGSVVAAVMLRILEEKLRSVSWAFGSGLVLCLLAAWLTLPRYRLAMKTSAIAWLRWLASPVLALCFICWLYFAQRAWLENNVASLRMIIYALILIVFALLRPQGLFGRSEFGAHLFRRGKNVGSPRAGDPKAGSFMEQ